MDLFELNGRVVVNLTDAVKAFNDLQKEGQQTEGKMKKIFSGIGKSAAAVGKTVAKGLAVSAAAVGALVTKSIQSYAEYEQLVGGVDTLFKDSSKKVQEYAANAYKTAGLSANEYMSTVTSFSASLLQSLDGDTQKAADAAHRAITDMSDNANKMGTSMEMIQNAYNGFAKQNYTMLDNLKLGYGGTKEEMQRLLKDASKIAGVKFNISSYADVVEAIHVMQEEMGIAGTTAKEAASTISGSLSSMKGAWQNLLTAVSSDDLPFDKYVDAFVESITAVTVNLMPRIETALGGVVKLVDKLVPVLLSKIPSLFQTLLPAIIESAVALVNSVNNALPAILGTITSVLPSLISAVGTILNTTIQLFPQILEQLMIALTSGLLPQLISTIVGVAVTIVTELPKILGILVAYVPQAILQLANAIISNAPILLQGIISAISEILGQLPTIVTVLLSMVRDLVSMVLTEFLPVALPLVVDAIVMLIEMIASNLGVLLPLIINMVISIVDLLIEQLPVIIPMLIEACITIIMAIIAALPDILVALTTALPGLLKSVWNAIVMVFINLPQWFGQLFSGAVQIIMATFNVVPTFFGKMFQKAWNAVKNAFSNVGSFFSGVWKKIKNSFTSIGTKIGDAISGAVKSGVNGLIGLVEKRINGFLKLINGAIGIINEIPGVSISKIKLVSFQRLAQGGVVDKPTPAIFGEDGAEAVVPLENNTGWIRKVSKQLHEFTVDGSEMQGAWDRRSVEIQQQQLSAMGRIEQKIQALLELLEDFFPEALGRMNRVMEMDGVVVARTLAPRMDVELGRLAVSKERGAR